MNKEILKYEPVIFTKLFTPEEIDNITKQAGKILTQESMTGGNYANSGTAVRRSQVKWIPKQTEYKWIYDRLLNAIKTSNKDNYNFNLNDYENIQYTVYKENEYGFYNWHIDTLSTKDTVRKISCVCFLTDPKEYEGGQFLINDNGVPHPIEANLGDVVIFPSWIQHTVTPVIKGIRKTLVVWASGDHFK